METYMTAQEEKKKSSKKTAKPAGHSRIALAVVSVSSAFTLISLATYNYTDSSFLYDSSAAQAPANMLGFVGAYYASLLLYFFGISAWLIPVTLLYCIRIMLFDLTWKREIDRLMALPMLLFVSTALNYQYTFELYRGISAGGWCGSALTTLLSIFFSQANRELFLCTAVGLNIIIARFSSISYLYPLAELLRNTPVRESFKALGRVSKTSDNEHHLTPQKQ